VVLRLLQLRKELPGTGAVDAFGDERRAAENAEVGFVEQRLRHRHPAVAVHGVDHGELVGRLAGQR